MIWLLWVVIAMTIVIAIAIVIVMTAVLASNSASASNSNVSIDESDRESGKYSSRGQCTGGRRIRRKKCKCRFTRKFH